ncbi:site-specific DNA-methyltransferase (adenine-specific) [Paraburkholderia caballeronis]|uniref:Methyltransferase n=2 Tax=Paraburkholderia caballeronis TaxID=416943 RepID=A0A1H7VRE4_9BURK|nr:site-specific DNA-methyltransferase (adenine-specific) [Paraburkholderia caballeronis]PXW93789.1 site-specific DNA-methyltransferase (adenine-specific) [Paraburkholderia caballeronis]RAJ89029.1 site-specific DNA-methyltransferase (adenine-specific) [Paraburkholderia caballeronis]SEE00116.1 site-specific DNA-methyltransferase (adenine-specific) [Paraburkholderia caballeronis]SEM11730.1 site-specific DNA-methyltransferase (adenine-specific) [Paraburkholderia caballeronis]
MASAPVIIGSATLYCADCLDVLPTLARVDAVIADPPYCIPHRFGMQKHRDGGLRTLQFAWDDAALRETVIEAVKTCARLSDTQFWFCGLHQASLVADALLEAGMTPKPAAWVKLSPPPAMKGNWWPSGFELAVYAYRRGAWFGDANSRRSNVFRFDSYRYGQPGKEAHPTQKSLKLMRFIVGSLARPGGMVLDPFMGSGTTGVAAVEQGRAFVGMERERPYFEIACRRIEDAQRQRMLFEHTSERQS